jgi:TonB family protein
MRFASFICVFGAILLHAAFLLFGGALIPDAQAHEDSLAPVDLLSETEKEDDKAEEPEETPVEEVTTEAVEAPDASEIIRNLEVPTPADAPALEAASLSAIEAALSGAVGDGGDFAQALSFTSGGRIGGRGQAGALDESLENAFSLAEIDQKPRVLFQAAAPYPAAMRGKKIEGVVTLLFVVDASGKVVNPKVERASHPAFEKPALASVKQWRFEPAVRGGQRVACRMRVPIRFTPS